MIDPKTGYIKALVGSRNEPTTKKTLNRAYQARMSVGSSIKPLAVYGPAFDKGYGLATSIANVKVPIDGWNTKEGYPLTSTGTTGWISLRTAIVNSLTQKCRGADADGLTTINKASISYKVA